MEIINIEKNTLRSVVAEFLKFKTQVLSLCNSGQYKPLGEWLDNQDVCLILNISYRTLQDYRDTGKISFSRIKHKMYYKASDIEKLLITKNKL